MLNAGLRPRTDVGPTWCVMSGRASLMSRFILRMTPMCSSLLSSEYLSSRCRPMRPPPPPWEALYVSRLAFERTTIRRCESLSLAGMGWCCSATSRGRAGGGSDWVPVNDAMASVVCSAVYLGRSAWLGRGEKREEEIVKVRGRDLSCPVTQGKVGRTDAQPNSHPTTPQGARRETDSHSSLVSHQRRCQHLDE